MESAFDSYLRGVSGDSRLHVDSLGRPHGGVPADDAAEAGSHGAAHARREAPAGRREGARLRHPARANDGQWAANGGAIVAMDPQDGSILAMASSPTYKPSVYAGRVDEVVAREPGPPDEDGAGEELSVAQSLVDGDVSARLGVQAGDRARRDAGAPRLPVRVPAVHGHLPLAERQGAPGLQQLGPERQSADGHADCARLLVRHVLLPTRRRVLSLPKDRGQPLQNWARIFGFGSLTGSDSGRRRAVSCRRSAGGSATFKTEIDKLWKPGDSIQLAIGQGDLPVTPLQMARFYALLANGGKLVTPHLLMDVENPNGTSVPIPRAPPPRHVDIDPAALADRPAGTVEGTHLPFGTSYPDLRPLPRLDRGQDRDGGEGHYASRLRRAQGPVVVVRLRPDGQCQARVCVVIENGGHGGTAAAPAAAQLFASYFHVKVNRRPRPLRLWHDGLMLEYAGSQEQGSSGNARGPRPGRDRALAGLAARRGRRRPGCGRPLGDLRRHAVRRPEHDPSYFLDRQIVYVAVGVVALVVRARDPDIYRRYWRAIFIATAG